MQETQELSTGQQQQQQQQQRQRAHSSYQHPKRSFRRTLKKTRTYSSDTEAIPQAPSPVDLSAMFSADDLLFYTLTVRGFRAHRRDLKKKEQNSLKESAVSKHATPTKRPNRPQSMAPRGHRLRRWFE
jgi:hypothetical protein